MGWFHFSIFNYQLSIINSQFSIINFQLSIINFLIGHKITKKNSHTQYARAFFYAKYLF